MQDCKFLFIRHGETEANIDDLCAGGDNVTPLTELGRSQIAITAAKLEELGIIPDKIIYSPAVRTVQTIDVLIANNSNYHNLPLIEIPEFKERLFGEFEDKSFELVRKRVWSPDFYPEGGEQCEAFISRVKKALAILAEDDSELPIVVSHGMVFDAIHRVFEQKAPWALNGDVYEFSITNGELTTNKICEYNE